MEKIKLFNSNIDPTNFVNSRVKHTKNNDLLDALTLTDGMVFKWSSTLNIYTSIDGYSTLSNQDLADVDWSRH